MGQQGRAAPIGGTGSWPRGPRVTLVAGPSALSHSPSAADDASVLVDWLAFSGWALLVIALLALAVVIGLLTGRLFVRASGPDQR